MIHRLVFLAATFFFVGCFNGGNQYRYNREPAPGSALYTPADPPPELAECAPDADAWDEARRLYEDTEWSIHELITCGQVQVRLAQSLLAIVLASNEEIFRQDTFERVSEYANQFGLDLEAPFERAEEGRWSMPIPSASSDSQFWVQFFEPGSDEPILADPFDLDSYLTGVRVETTLTLDEMLDDLWTRNEFSFYWETEGPLVSLLNGGEPVANPFIVNVSIVDIASLVYPGIAEEGEDFGPLVSLVDAEMMSCVDLSDDRNGSQIEYRADGRRDTVGNIAGDGSVSFDVNRITATDGTYVLVGDASNLRFLGRKNLAGEIFYDLTGRDVSLQVVSDFEDGNAWPITRWMCL
jgi:hypothetical protein